MTKQHKSQGSTYSTTRNTVVEVFLHKVCYVEQTSFPYMNSLSPKVGLPPGWFLGDYQHKNSQEERLVYWAFDRLFYSHAFETLSRHVDCCAATFTVMPMLKPLCVVVLFLSYIITLESRTAMFFSASLAYIITLDSRTATYFSVLLCLHKNLWPGAPFQIFLGGGKALEKKFLPPPIFSPRIWPIIFFYFTLW